MNRRDFAAGALAAGAAGALLGLAFAGLLFHLVRVSIDGRGGVEVRLADESGHDAADPGPLVGLPGLAVRPAPAPAPARSGFGHALLLAVPIAAVVIAGLWTPGPVAIAFEQVVDVLDGGHG